MSEKKSFPSKYVTTHVDLAARLGVDRRTINLWKRKFPDHPRPRSDGKLCVAEWEEFCKARDLGGVGDDPDELLDKEQWSAKYTKRKTEKLEFEMAVQRGEYVLIQEVRDDITRSIVGARKVLAAAARSLAPVLGGQEPAEIEKRITQAHDEAIAELQRVKWASE